MIERKKENQRSIQRFAWFVWVGAILAVAINFFPYYFIAALAVSLVIGIVCFFVAEEFWLSPWLVLLVLAGLYGLTAAVVIGVLKRRKTKKDE